MYIRKKQILINNLVKKSINYYCKELKLEKINYKYNDNNLICFSVKVNYKKGVIKKFIQLDYFTILQIVKIKNDNLLFKLYPLNSIKKRIKFIVYHELSHYLQYAKYNNFYHKNRLKNKRLYFKLSDYEYRQLKIEKIADKLAYAILQREYKII
jgi:hypothetical protein